TSSSSAPPLKSAIWRSPLERINMYRLTFFAVLMAGIAALPLIGQTSPEGMTGRPIVLSDCPIAPEKEIHVPVKVPGVLAEFLVDEGDEVEENQLLAKMDDVLA